MADTLRILYVDDEPDLLEIGKLFLEDGGAFAVDTLPSAGQALEQLNTERYDAIISDYQMPWMDGIQFLVEVRKRFGLVPFILLTGRGREEVVIQAINSGVDFYLQNGGDPKAQFAELSHKILMAVERRTSGKALHESETRFRALIDNASDIFRILDREGRIVFDTAAFGHLLGYPPGFTIGRSPMEFIHPDDLGKMKRELSEVYNNTNPGVPTEFRLRRADGSYTRVESSGKNLIGVPGIDGIVITTRFIDKRKEAEDSLRKSEDKYRRLVETASEGVWAMDEQFVTTYVNERMAGMLGYTVDEMLGKMIMSFMPGEELADNQSKMEERMNGQPGSYERRFRVKDGTIRIFNVSSTPLTGDDGSFKGSFAMLTDITARKQAEEALKMANKKLNLLSGITRHDITNQLTILNGYLVILEKKRPDPSLNVYLQKVRTAAQRISSMIQFTKEYEHIGFHAPVWHDCRTLVDTAAKEAPLGKVIVKNDLPVSAELFADPLIVKVFYNLMDNAVRYGGKITSIRFSVKDRDGVPVVVCEDDGDGVLAEEKERIFERGFGKNTGLGLFLSKEILSITGITIAETGVPGKGARFEMTIPKGMWHMTGNDA
jgi:PAS domain S-box-containing protein